MKFYPKIIFLFFTVLICTKSDRIYNSCYEALTMNSYATDNYLIQPSVESHVSKIFCQQFNDSYGLVIIDNDSENMSEMITDPNIGYHTYLERVVQYENFTELDMTLFLSNIGMCSQGMKIVTFGASGNSQRVIFWDGKQFYSNQGWEDGICKCFIKNICELTNNSSSVCNITFNDSVLKSDEGEFSVKSERLPIHKLRFSDINTEWVKYKIWKLKCYFPLYKINFNKHPKNCDFINIHNLYDLKENTCIKTKYSFLSIKINFDFKQNKLKLITKNNFNCKLNIVGYTIENHKYLNCKINDNCEISCQKSRIIYLEIFKEFSKTFISICEIYVI